jgi:HPt (histidine-containing phosphotransfer) domain-containing protein
MSSVVIDPIIFSEISLLMEDSLPIFIETYIENTRKLLESLEQAVPAGDSESVFQNVHQLKGGSGSIGAIQVLQIARKMEDVIKDGNGEAQLGTLFAELKSAYDAAEAELKTHLE